MNNPITSANWKTTVSGIGATVFTGLTALAIMPDQLGELSTIIPSEYKTKVLVASASAAFVLRVWNSVQQKDKNVTGGSVQQTITGKVAEPGTQTLVDQTLIASKASGEKLSDEHEEILATIEKTKP